MADLNWVAILVAAVAHFLLGGLWYSPMLFAKPFMTGIGKSEEELRSGAKPSALMYGGAFTGGLVKSAGLALVLAWIGELSVAESALVGVLIGLAIHGAGGGHELAVRGPPPQPRSGRRRLRHGGLGHRRGDHRRHELNFSRGLRMGG